MKLIKAIIRPNKLEEVKDALTKLGISGMTVTEVRGHGRQKGHKAIYRGTEYSVTLLPKIMVELVLPEQMVDDAIKTVIVVTPGGPETRTLALVVEEGKRHGLPTITHAVTVQDTLAAVEAQTTVLVHTPHIGQLTEEEARAIAASRIPMMSTLGVFVPFFDENNKPIFRDALPFPWPTLSSAGQGPVNARLLWEAGVTYGYGTDTRFLPRDTLAHELKALHLVFSPQDIIRILTRNAAVTVGREQEIGTLEAGKLADLVVLDGNPLEDLYDLLDVDVVIKGGAVLVDKR